MRPPLLGGARDASQRACPSHPRVLRADLPVPRPDGSWACSFHRLAATCSSAGWTMQSSPAFASEALEGRTMTAQGEALGNVVTTHTSPVRAYYPTALGWRLARPFRAKEDPHPLPRASPWAIIVRPFGAEGAVRRNGAVATQPSAYPLSLAAYRGTTWLKCYLERRLLPRPLSKNFHDASGMRLRRGRSRMPEARREFSGRGGLGEERLFQKGFLSQHPQ